MTRDEIMQMDEDALRLAVAKALGYRWFRVSNSAYLVDPVYAGLSPKGCVEVDVPAFGDRRHGETPDWPRDPAAAIDLLDSMTYPGEDTHVEYIIIKQTYNHIGNIDPRPTPIYYVEIYGRNPIRSANYETKGETLALAATRAWLMWREGAE